MAQSANKRTPLGIDAFWDKPTHDPPLRWEKWRVQYRLALLANDKIILDTLLGPKPEMMDLPLEPIYEETINGASICLIRKREKCSKRPAKDELAKQVPMSNRNQHNVWRQAMASCGSKKQCLYSTSVGRTSDRKLYEPAHPDLNLTAEFWKIVED